MLHARSCLPAAVSPAYPSFAELSSLDDKKARDAGKDLKKAVTGHVATRAEQDLTHKQMIILKGSACPGASAFLTVVGTFKRDRLTPDEWRTAVRIRCGLPHEQLRAVAGAGDCLGRDALRAKGKARVAHDAMEAVLAEISKEAGREVDTEVRGLYGAYPNQTVTATKLGENRRVDMLEQDYTTGLSNMTDNFITDGAGAGGSVGNPLKLMEAAEKKKIKKYVDGTGPPGFSFTPLGFGVSCEMSETTRKWLSDAALAVAKRKSDNAAYIDKQMPRIRWRFMQRLGITLMRAQAHMIYKHALSTSRRQYITTLSRRRRAGHGRGRGVAAARAARGGGSGSVPRAGRER